MVSRDCEEGDQDRECEVAVGGFLEDIVDPLDILWLWGVEQGAQPLVQVI